MTPDKRVEEVLTDFDKRFDTPQASGFDRVTSENTIEQILNDFIKYAHEPDCIEKLRTTLTQRDQDMISEVVEKIEKHEFTIDIEEYLAKVNAWAGGYDKPFDDGHAQTKQDIIKLLRK